MLRSLSLEHIAMTVSRPAPRLLNRAIHSASVSKWMLAALIIGAGLVCLTVASQVRGAVVPIEQIRSTGVVPASVEGAHPVAAPARASLPLPGVSVVRFRFGFLEFEDDPDASAQ